MNLSDTVSTKAHRRLQPRPGGWCHRDRNEWQEVPRFSRFIGSVGENHEQLPNPIPWMPLIFSRTKNYTKRYLTVWGFHGCNIVSYMDANLSWKIQVNGPYIDPMERILMQASHFSRMDDSDIFKPPKKPFVNLQASHLSFLGAKRWRSHFSGYPASHASSGEGDGQYFTWSRGR